VSGQISTANGRNAPPLAASGHSAPGPISAILDLGKDRLPNEVAEMALAHAIGSKTEAAYRRGALLEKRRELMNAWGRFCTAESGKVVKLATGV